MLRELKVSLSPVLVYAHFSPPRFVFNFFTAHTIAGERRVRLAWGRRVSSSISSRVDTLLHNTIPKELHNSIRQDVGRATCVARLVSCLPYMSLRLSITAPSTIRLLIYDGSNTVRGSASYRQRLSYNVPVLHVF